MSDGKAKPNRSLREKTGARMAVVQSLYRVAVTGEALKPASLVAELKRQIEANPGDNQIANIPPNYSFMEKLLTGIAEQLGAIDQMLDRHLTDQWKRDRMSALSIAILQAGIYELRFHDTLKTPVIITQYTDLAGQFLDAGEVDFVHALLNKLATQLRN